jgi:hypothetical protein
MRHGRWTAEYACPGSHIGASRRVLALYWQTPPRTPQSLTSGGAFTRGDTGTMRYTRGNAFGNNPSGLYGVWDWLLGLPVFYLGPQDAVLWVGCTPPPLAYFSARSYVFSSPWPNATVLFASLGDSNNIETVNTTAGGPCNRTTAIITTGEVAAVVSWHCR